MSQQAANGLECRGKVLNVDNMNPNVRRVEYAVRGAIVQRALQIEKELKEVPPRLSPVICTRPGARKTRVLFI